jgi:hypothetical protein
LAYIQSFHDQIFTCFHFAQLQQTLQSFFIGSRPFIRSCSYRSCSSLDLPKRKVQPCIFHPERPLREVAQHLILSTRKETSHIRRGSRTFLEGLSFGPCTSTSLCPQHPSLPVMRVTLLSSHAPMYNSIQVSAVTVFKLLWQCNRVYFVQPFLRSQTTYQLLTTSRFPTIYLNPPPYFPTSSIFPPKGASQRFSRSSSPRWAS